MRSPYLYDSEVEGGLHLEHFFIQEVHRPQYILVESAYYDELDRSSVHSL